MDTLSVIPGIFDVVLRTFGPQLLGKLFLGTLGRSAVKIALWSWLPYIPALCGDELIEKALDTIAPPPAVVITTTAKSAAGSVAATLATQGLYLVLSGAKATLVYVRDASGLGNLINFANNLFAEPEQTAKFLPATSPGLAIIEDYTVPDEKKAMKAPALPPYMSQSAIHSSTFSEPTNLNSSSIGGVSFIGRSSRIRPGPAPAVVQVNEAQKDLIVTEFQGNKREVKDIAELRNLLNQNNEWQDVLDLLDDDPNETAWMSASVVLQDKNARVTNFQQSRIEDLSASQHQPSAPPMWN